LVVSAILFIISSPPLGDDLLAGLIWTSRGFSWSCEKMWFIGWFMIHEGDFAWLIGCLIMYVLLAINGHTHIHIYIYNTHIYNIYICMYTCRYVYKWGGCLLDYFWNIMGYHTHSITTTGGFTNQHGDLCILQVPGGHR
jgi:hypothetical protein